MAIKFLKIQDQAVQRITNYMTYLKARGRIPCTLCDNRDTEFMNDKGLNGWYHSQGIKLQLTMPSLPSQKEVAE